MKLTQTTTMATVLSLVLFGAACSRSTQSQDTAPVPSSTTQNTQTQKNTQAGSTQQDGSSQTGDQNETSNGQSSGGTENEIVKPQDDTTADTSGTPATTTASARSAKTCLEELQAQFGPDIVFPAQQLFPKQYEAARAQGAGGAAALKQALSSAPCAQLK